MEVNMTDHANHEKTAGYAVFFLRLVLGVVFFMHVYTGVGGMAIPGTDTVFSVVGMSEVGSYFTYVLGLLVGASLILGLYTRVAAVLAMLFYVGGMFAYYGNGWVFSSTGGGWEYPFVMFFVAIVVAMLGGGHYAAGTLGDLVGKVTGFFK